jgi:hypothetical protein
MQVRLKVVEFAEEKGQRLRPLRTWKFFQVQEESAQAQEGAQQPSDRLERDLDHWKVFTSREHRRSAQKNRSEPLDLIQKYPTAIRSDRRCTGFNPS